MVTGLADDISMLLLVSVLHMYVRMYVYASQFNSVLMECANPGSKLQQTK